MYNEWHDYELVDGKACAVVFRERGKAQIKLCPFCQDVHSHGLGQNNDPTHTHCTNGRFFAEVVAPDGTIMKQSSGYIIREI